jgi:hypothetical protein
MATEGGLIAYGPEIIDQFRRAASYVDRVLRGEKPADMPVQAPTKYELVINLKTAKALGLTVSPSLLASADIIIEAPVKVGALRPVLLFLLFWLPTRSIDVILKSLNFFFLLFCPPTKSIDMILKSLNFAYRRL